MITINDNNYYALCLFISLGVSVSYILFKNRNKYCLLFFLLSLPIIIFCGLLFTYIFFNTKHLNINQLGLSSLGCLIGYLISINIFKIITNRFKITINISSYYFIIPLAYSIGKIGCFFHGCCKGFIYNGLLSVHYYNSEDNYFPIQLVESITFIILFILLNKYKNKKYINEFTIISFCIIKFILDYFRYSHNMIISVNQIFSLLLILITILILKIKLDYNKN